MLAWPSGHSAPIEILHLTFSHFPADPRVKREMQALRPLGRRLAVVALRGPGERAVERRDGVLVLRVPSRKSRGGFISYLRDYLEFTWRCRRLVADHPRLASVRAVHVHTLPDFLLWSALPAKRRGARVILDLHEIFPEFVRARFAGMAGAVFEAVGRRIERWARRRADLTITVNRPIDALLAARPIGRTEHRIIVHNSADAADFGIGPVAQSSLFSPGAPLELVYHGTLTGLYGVDVAIRGMALARGTMARFTIIGDGPDREALTRLVNDLGLQDQVRLEPPIPQSALAQRLSRYHAGVVPTRLDRMTRFSLSNKLLEYVHLGIPILAARLPSYAEYLGDDAAWYWTPGDPDDFARTISTFATTGTDERRRHTELARARIEPIAWNLEAERLRQAYRALLGSE